MQGGPLNRRCLLFLFPILFLFSFSFSLSKNNGRRKRPLFFAVLDLRNF